MKSVYLLLAAFFLLACTSCHNPQPTESGPADGGKARKQVVEVEPIDNGKVVAGQTIYVPAYSSIYTSVSAHRFELAVTLSVRNTDQVHPMILTQARYYDHDGQLIRDYLKKPLRIGPMASTEFFVSESDTKGGVSASFLVEWVAEQNVTAPVVESVIIGTSSTQGISFVCAGRVLAERSRAAK
jgi:Protein of unknown function (DUF3124)